MMRSAIEQALGVAALLLALSGDRLASQALRNVGPNPNQFPYSSTYSDVLQIRDLDGDGSPDVLSGASWPGVVALVSIGDGRGRFAAPRAIPLPSHLSATHIGQGASCVLDLDYDGDLDLIGTSHRSQLPGIGPGPLVTYLNDGTSVFTVDLNARFPSVGAIVASRIDAFDANGDGRMDACINELVAPLPRMRLFLADAFGAFRESLTAFPPMTGSLADLSPTDIDHDGDTDLVLTTLGGGNNLFIWTNDGAGGFAQSFVFPSLWCLNLAVGDLSGDGHVDVVFAADRIAMEVWLGDGFGSFTHATGAFPFPWPGRDNRRFSVQVVDLDGDDSLDIVSLKADTGLELFLNDGHAVFRDGRAELGLAGYTNVGLAFAHDVDRDGDTDLMFGSPQPDLWVGLRRQTLSDEPTIGGTLSIDLYARPQHVVSYLIGFARRDVFIPGIGWSALDPTLAVAWPAVATVPANGHFTTSLSVPNNPSLRGIQLFTQGLDVDPNTGLRAMNFWPCTIR